MYYQVIVQRGTSGINQVFVWHYCLDECPGATKIDMLHEHLPPFWKYHGLDGIFMNMAMATIKDLPYELLYNIIFLLVQSSDGAEDFAKIISVCRSFLLYAEDVSILRVVNFNIKMEFMKFYHFLCVRGLLVKCSEAGNVAARHLLGKVILVSSTHLFLSERQREKFDVSSCDLPTLNRVLDTNVPLQNSKVGSFMTYFSPIQAYASEFSPRRLVHYQLVKLFLLNGSHHDFVEMGTFLKYYIKYSTGVTRDNSCLITSIKLLADRAMHVGSMEKLAKTEELLNGYLRGLREFIEGKPIVDKISEDPFSDVDDYTLLLQLYLWKCCTDGVDWREAMSDVNFVEELRDDVCDELDKAHIEFSEIRAVTLSQYEHKFG